MMEAVFKEEGIVACDRELLNILVSTLANWVSQAWSTLFGIVTAGVRRRWTYLCTPVLDAPFFSSAMALM